MSTLANPTASEVSTPLIVPSPLEGEGTAMRIEFPDAVVPSGDAGRVSAPIN